MEDIVIKKDGDYGFDVWQGDKHGSPDKPGGIKHIAL